MLVGGEKGWQTAIVGFTSRIFIFLLIPIFRPSLFNLRMQAKIHCVSHLYYFHSHEEHNS